MINASNCSPAFAYDIFFIADALGGGFVWAGGVFAGSATSSFLGVLDLVFALGAGAGAASNAASCLGADFGLDADLAFGADSKIISSFAFFLGVAVETEAARFGALSSSIFIGSSCGLVGTLFALAFALAFTRILGLTILGYCGFGVGGGASLGSGVVVFSAGVNFGVSAALAFGVLLLLFAVPVIRGGFGGVGNRAAAGGGFGGVGNRTAAGGGGGGGGGGGLAATVISFLSLFSLFNLSASTNLNFSLSTAFLIAGPPDGGTSGGGFAIFTSTAIGDESIFDVAIADWERANASRVFPLIRTLFDLEIAPAPGGGGGGPFPPNSTKRLTKDWSAVEECGPRWF